MRLSTAWSTALVLLVCLCAPAFAHRVNIFAYVDGDRIRVECGFSRTQKVRNGRIIVADTVTGARILEGTTNEQGGFSFPLSEEFLRLGHDLTIRIIAGEGHQNEWTVTAEELKALSPSAFPDAAAPDPAQGDVSGRPEPSVAPDPVQGGASGRPGPSPAAVPAASDARPLPVISERELEAIVGRALDVKLAPVKLALTQARERNPDIRDIIGGIGWILGLIGLAAYMKYRP